FAHPRPVPWTRYNSTPGAQSFGLTKPSARCVHVAIPTPTDEIIVLSPRTSRNIRAFGVRRHHYRQAQLASSWSKLIEPAKLGFSLSHRLAASAVPHIRAFHRGATMQGSCDRGWIYRLQTAFRSLVVVAMIASAILPSTTAPAVGQTKDEHIFD